MNPYHVWPTRTIFGKAHDFACSLDLLLKISHGEREGGRERGERGEGGLYANRDRVGDNQRHRGAMHVEDLGGLPHCLLFQAQRVVVADHCLAARDVWREREMDGAVVGLWRRGCLLACAGVRSGRAKSGGSAGALLFVSVQCIPKTTNKQQTDTPHPDFEQHKTIVWGTGLRSPQPGWVPPRGRFPERSQRSISVKHSVFKDNTLIWILHYLSNLSSNLICSIFHMIKCCI